MAPVDGLLVGIVSLVIGALAIHVAARLVLSGSQSFLNAVIAAGVGALVYALLGFLGGIPVIGPLILLVLWVAVINWRYPGGWINAAVIGLVAWLAAMVIMWVLSMANILARGAMGVPGV